MSAPSRRRALVSLLVILAPLLGGCGDGTGPSGTEGDEVGVVVNSLDVSLTLFPVEGGTPVTVGLAPAGSPVGLSVAGGLAAVPLGSVPAVALVDLERAVVDRTVALPPGSGATGSAFVGDTLVLVANPGRNSVTPVDVRTGTAGAEIPVGGYPQGVVVAGERIFVLEANLGPDFEPAGPGTLTVLSTADLAPLGTVTLSGENPGEAATGPGGLLYVVTSGRFGGGDGGLSVVDPATLEEVARHEGFGDFPFAAAFGPDGRLHVASFSYGIAVWDPAGATFVRPPSDPVRPEGVGSVSGLAFDADGRLHALRPDCAAPSAVLRLDAAFQVEATIPAGTCPLDIAFIRPPA